MVAFYNEYMALYKDEELACVATATTINDLLLEGKIGSGRKTIESTPLDPAYFCGDVDDPDVIPGVPFTSPPPPTEN